MATWDDMEGFSWDELELFSYDELERLSLPELRRAVNVVWPILTKLSVNERELLALGLREGSIPLSAALYHTSDPSSPEMQARFAASEIWQKLKPKSRKEAFAYAALIVALVGPGLATMVDQKPDINVVIQIMPEQLRPSPTPTPPTSPTPPEELDA